MNKFAITYKKLKQFSKKFNKTRTNKVLKNVNSNNNFKSLITKADYNQNKRTSFKNIINIKTKITDQKNSGRCWIFAFLNVMRIPMIKKYDLSPDFEFSQNYLFFYDKLEKANYFLNYIYFTKNQNIHNIKNYKINDLKVINMLDNLTNDGGSWIMFCQLIKKYGIIPKSNMDDDYHSTNSKELNIFFNNFLRKAAKIVRESKLTKDKIISSLLEDCYKILVIFLGEPPKKITWEYYKENSSNTNKSNLINKEYKYLANISPQDFYKKYVPYNVDDKYVLINYPCQEIPFYNNYIIENNLQVIENTNKKDYNKKDYNKKYSNNLKLLNVPIDVMKNALKKSIDNEEAVWTGIDVKKYVSKTKGFMDIKGFNYDDVFGFNNLMDKCDSLKYRQSTSTHAVTIKGYNLNKKSKTNGYLVENSWGDDNGFKGNYYMAEDWFDQYVYRIVIDKKCISKKELNAYKKPPIVLPFWSSFGYLMSI